MIELIKNYKIILLVIAVIVFIFLPIHVGLKHDEDLVNSEEPPTWAYANRGTTAMLDIKLTDKDPDPPKIPTPTQEVVITNTPPRAITNQQPAIQIKQTYSATQVREAICKVFTSNCERAIAIAQCESSLNPSAVGDLHIYPHSYGLFQIRGLQGRPNPNWLLDMNNNINYAYQMSGGGTNWGAWSCSRKV